MKRVKICDVGGLLLQHRRKRKGEACLESKVTCLGGVGSRSTRISCPKMGYANEQDKLAGHSASPECSIGILTAG